MSKSKGNFLTLRGTLPTALDVRGFRYLVVSSQYRTTLGFSGKSLEGAKNTVKRLDKVRVSVACLCLEGGRFWGGACGWCCLFAGVGACSGLRGREAMIVLRMLWARSSSSSSGLSCFGSS